MRNKREKKYCLVYYSICATCGNPFAKQRKTRKYCNDCVSSTNKARARKGLVELKRKCLHCGNDFTTYNKEQFACPRNKRCQGVVGRMRFSFTKKMRRFLGLCYRCGAEAHGYRTCKACNEKAKEKDRKRRSKWVKKGYCRECGTEDVLPGRRVCKRCVKRKRKEQALRRAERNGVLYVDAINIDTLFNRDNGRCQLCGKKLKLKTKNRHRREPTIDHIIPISLGGEESYRNVQLACRVCNSRKGNRPDGHVQQLRLC